MEKIIEELINQRIKIAEELVSVTELQSTAIDEMNSNRLNRLTDKRDELINTLKSINEEIELQNIGEINKFNIDELLKKVIELDIINMDKAKKQKIDIQGKIQDIKKGKKVIGKGYGVSNIYSNGTNFDTRN